MRHHIRYIRKRRIPWGADNFLSVLEGVEGGFAISTGLIAGLSFAEPVSRDIILVTAVISMIVNAFNASAVKYSSEHYVDELDGREKRHAWHYYFVPAFIEFIMYLVVCLITLTPLLFIDSIQHATWLCVAITLLVLFWAGVYRGRMLRTHPLRDGFELMSLGGMIIAVGAIAGFVLTR